MSISLLILIIMWSFVLIIGYTISGLAYSIRFANSDMTKALITGGYVDENFIQLEIMYPISIYILYTLALIVIIILLIISIFNPPIIKVVGSIIIAQNIIILSLRAWLRFFTNGIDTISINIKLYLLLSIVLVILSIILSLKKNFLYHQLIFITILQITKLIYSAPIVIRYINVNMIKCIFNFFDCIITIILYWLLIFSNRNII